MVKGASIRFTNYVESVPKILGLLKLGNEIKKYDKIVLKPWISMNDEESTDIAFVEAVLKYVSDNKNPVAEVFIAEGVDGEETDRLFAKMGYLRLAERYSVGLVDLNKAETEVVDEFDFAKFEGINYPKILKESFVISLPKLSEHEEFGMLGGLSNMLGAFPSDYYKGFFSKSKNKIRKHGISYSIHDIVQCKMPDFSVVDSSEQGILIAGLSEEMDRQGARILGRNWEEIEYLRLLEEGRQKKEEMSEEE
ncbi:MAG: DUF362 domain-containing protein [Nanoarchaeota archaeon]|nr:DUF362 domain-containing protein [Nanoarchaeota archaeon]